MLFHSQIFLLGFLPLVLALFYAAAARPAVRGWLLIAASWAFYAYWDARLLPLLVASIAVNWGLSRLLGALSARAVLALGLLFNLGLLGFFKYADFAAGTLAWLGGWEHRPWSIVLPLAISFFTFQQISYVVDLGRGAAPRYGFRDYALYVSFFPQLIAGPIVRHNEIIHQFAEDPRRDGLHERLGRGAALFAIGLAKKVFLADQLAGIADPVFRRAVAGEPLAALDAWAGTWAYFFQLYFDFSGYSDMAIGLGLLFGFVLPLNFDAPYRATSIRDFWRRWHMTLTRFFRDYVYVPVGTRIRAGRRWTVKLPDTVATMLTMTLIGLWHGAGWSYVLFGAIHGIAMVVNQVWRRGGLRMPAVLGWLLTMLFFAMTLVLFRSESVPASFAMLSAMWSGEVFSGAAAGVDAKRLALIGLAALAAFAGPTSQRLGLELLTPRRVYAVTVAAVLASVVVMGGAAFEKEFIYFQF